MHILLVKPTEKAPNPILRIKVRTSTAANDTFFKYNFLKGIERRSFDATDA